MQGYRDPLSPLELEPNQTKRARLKSRRSSPAAQPPSPSYRSSLLPPQLALLSFFSRSLTPLLLFSLFLPLSFVLPLSYASASTRDHDQAGSPASPGPAKAFSDRVPLPAEIAPPLGATLRLGHSRRPCLATGCALRLVNSVPHNSLRPFDRVQCLWSARLSSGSHSPVPRAYRCFRSPGPFFRPPNSPLPRTAFDASAGERQGHKIQQR